jgi:syringate O-demethylase
MTDKTLQQLLDDQGNIVEFLRNQQTGPNAYPGVPAEYSNWRDEQRSWAETAVLFNQSFHMVDLLVTGPGAFDMLAYLAPNSFKGFVPNRAKQFAPVTPEGHVIGDVILFYLEEEKFELVGRAPSIEWVEYWASTGKWDVKVERDERTIARPLDQQGYRRNYRFQLQGPNAMKILTQAMGEQAPDLKFFHMAPITIAGVEVRALRHGMAGQPGYELFGPWKDYDTVRNALIEAHGACCMVTGCTTLDVLEALLGWLGQSDAASVVVTLEDLWGEERRQNQPGTGAEEPNWCRRMTRTVDDLGADPAIVARLGRLRAARGVGVSG